MAHDVFISYASEDKPAADAACAVLESKGIRCWIAPRDILPGVDWGESVINALNQSRAFVLVFSSNANASPQIKREVERAVNRGLPVIPLRIEDVAPEKSLEYFISSPHWLDAFTPPLERHLNYLADVLAHIIEKKEVSPKLAQPVMPATRVGARYRYAWIAATAAVVLVGVTLGVWKFLWPAQPPLQRDLVTDCDRLAASADDPQRPPGVAGVAIDKIDIVPALAACNAAMRRYPDVARFVFQAGRVASAQKDYVVARQLYEKAAAAGSAAAMSNLGNLFYHGNGAPKDYAEARKWFEKAAAVGIAVAMNDLGVLYRNGDGVPQDYAEARRWFEKAAAAGNAAGMNNLGNLYYVGNGVAKDYAQARLWYEKAAATGYPVAMTNLGNLYANGDGVQKDYAEARRWYEKAAAAGNATAMNNLGNLYYNGNGAPKDYAEARKWYEKAAAGGNSAAMNNLGNLYRNGSGVAQDYAAARAWYEKAAAAGNVFAMNSLGNLYYYGNGVPKDYAEARKWYEKAASAGNPAGMYNVGIVYYNGNGAPKDVAEARKWFEKAAALGYEPAKNMLKQLDASGQK